MFNPIIKYTIIFCRIKSVFTLLEHWSLTNIYLKQDSHTRSEVLSVLAKTIAVFWDVILCILYPEDGGSRSLQTSSNFPPDPHNVRSKYTVFFKTYNALKCRLWKWKLRNGNGNIYPQQGSSKCQSICIYHINIAGYNSK